TLVSRESTTLQRLPVPERAARERKTCSGLLGSICAWAGAHSMRAATRKPTSVRMMPPRRGGKASCVAGEPQMRGAGGSRGRCDLLEDARLGADTATPALLSQRRRDTMVVRPIRPSDLRPCSHGPDQGPSVRRLRAKLSLERL